MERWQNDSWVMTWVHLFQTFTSCRSCSGRVGSPESGFIDSCMEMDPISSFFRSEEKGCHNSQVTGCAVLFDGSVVWKFLRSRALLFGTSIWPCSGRWNQWPCGYRIRSRKDRCLMRIGFNHFVAHLQGHFVPRGWQIPSMEFGCIP